MRSSNRSSAQGNNLMRNGGKGTLAENERGTGPATPVSPATSASEQSRPDKFQAVARTILNAAAAIELTRRDFLSLGSDAPEDDGATEIEAEFRRKIAGLRRLPRQQRAAAVRAAREWFLVALSALREKRARDRHARHMLRRQQRRSPG